MSDIRAAIRAAMELDQGGRREQAEALLRRLVARFPSDADANHYLGLLLMRWGEMEPAAHFMKRSLEVAPTTAARLSNYGLALDGARRFQEGAAAFEAALRLDAAHAGALLGLARVSMSLCDFDRAVEACRVLIQCAPGNARAVIGASLALMQSARGDEAVRVLEAGLETMPEHPDLLSTLAATLNYRSGVSAAAVTAAHVRAGAAIQKQAGASQRMWPNTREADRKLRIGYLSPDLRDHAVASFIEPLLEHRDAEQFFVACYSTAPRRDAVSERLRKNADLWADCAMMDDAALLARLAADRIDVLVELSGHTLGNRLGVLARKAAPIQVSYLGYPATTGLTTMDARLVDHFTDPVGHDSLAPERLIRIDPSFVCYQPPEAAPELGSTRKQRVTFGSFNALPKLSEATLDLWADVLRAVPESVLLLKALPLASEAVRDRIRAGFATRGVARERLEFSGYLGDAEHLALYQRVDIALDPTPYNGTTTTCEALWMGVPVVSLVGDRHAARVGLSLLHAVGLGDLSAESPGEYIRIAADLAGDAARRLALHATLRARVRASVLCDGAAAAKRIEAAFRGLWGAYCGVRVQRPG